MALHCIVFLVLSRNKHKRKRLYDTKFDYFWCQNVIARFIGNRCDVFYILKKCKFLYGVNLYSVVYHCAQHYPQALHSSRDSNKYKCVLRELFSRNVDARFACNRPDVYCRKRRSSTSYLFVAQWIYSEWIKFAQTISIAYKWTNYDEKSLCRHDNISSFKSLLIKSIVLVWYIQ